MDGHNRVYLDICTLDAVAPLLGDARPAWVWSGDGRTILWSNAAGAQFFRAGSMDTLLTRTLPETAPARAHLERIATRGATDRDAIGRLRFYLGPKMVVVTTLGRRISLPDGEDGALIVAVDATGTSSDTPLQALCQLLASDTNAAFLIGAADAGDGGVIARAGTLAPPRPTSIVPDADAEDGGAMEATAEIDGARHAARIAHLGEGAGADFLLLVRTEPQSAPEMAAVTEADTAAGIAGAQLDAADAPETGHASGDDSAADAETAAASTSGETAADEAASAARPSLRETLAAKRASETAQEPAPEQPVEEAPQRRARTVATSRFPKNFFPWRRLVQANEPAVAPVVAEGSANENGSQENKQPTLDDKIVAEVMAAKKALLDEDAKADADPPLTNGALTAVGATDFVDAAGAGDETDADDQAATAEAETIDAGAAETALRDDTPDEAHGEGPDEPHADDADTAETLKATTGDTVGASGDDDSETVADADLVPLARAEDAQDAPIQADAEITQAVPQEDDTTAPDAAVSDEGATGSSMSEQESVETGAAIPEVSVELPATADGASTEQTGDAVEAAASAEDLEAGTDAAEDEKLPEAEAEVEADAEPETGARFVFAGYAPPVRFVWQMDAERRFTSVSPELAQVLGGVSTDIVGYTWSEVADRLGMDADGRIAKALERRDTWSGLTVDWPVTDNPIAVPVDLAALPAFDRNRVFEGYRGFGVCRPGDAMPMASQEPDDALPAALPPQADLAQADLPETDLPEAEEATCDAGETVTQTTAETVAQTEVAETPEPATPDVAAQEAPEDTPAVASAAPDVPTAATPDFDVDVPKIDDETPEAAREETGSSESGAAEAMATIVNLAEQPAAIRGLISAPSYPGLFASLDTSASGADNDSQDPVVFGLPEAANADVWEAAVTEEQDDASEPRLPGESLATVEGVDIDAEVIVEDTIAPEAPEMSEAPEASETSEASEMGAAGEPPLDDAARGTFGADNALHDVTPLLPFVRPGDSGAEGRTRDNTGGSESFAETVIRLAERKPNAPETLLTKPEREAFRKIAEALGNRIEDTNRVTPKPQPPEAVDGPVLEADEPDAEAPMLRDTEPEPADVFADVPVLDDETGEDANADETAAEEDAPVNAPIPMPIAARPTVRAADAVESRVSASEDVAIHPRLLDRLPIGVAIVRGRDVVYANNTLMSLLGYADLDALTEAGGLEAIFAEPEEWPTVAGPDEEVERTLRVQLSDGSLRPVDAHMHTVPWQGTRALMISLRDKRDPSRETAIDRLHETKAALARAEDRVAEMDAILDTATDGVLVLASDGRIVKANRSAQALFGVDDADMAGRSLTDFLAPESHRGALDYLDGLSRNGVASVLNDGREVIAQMSAGGLTPLFMTVGRISAQDGAGDDVKFCAVLRDITQWKKAEEELTRAKKQAENASSQKSDFLAKISHEIRTPLNAIIGFSEVMIEERFGAIGNDRYKDYLSDIHNSGSHLLSLVNDLLDLSKVEAGKLDLSFEAVPVNELISDCVALMQPQANRERIIIRTSLPASVPNIVADHRSLRQIVLNLLSNAIKFNQPGGQVIMSTALEANGVVVLRVRDTGIGMSAKDIKAALEPFRQLHTARLGGGTGLGLPLTKALVEANRAHFSIDSTPAHGTLVEVTFPSQRVLAE